MYVVISIGKLISESRTQVAYVVRIMITYQTNKEHKCCNVIQMGVSFSETSAKHGSKMFCISNKLDRLKMTGSGKLSTKKRLCNGHLS